MSQFTAQFQEFFESPAGLSLLTWLEEQRTTEHDRAESNPDQARDRSQAARVYKEVMQYIDSVQIGVVKPNRSSSGADT